MKKRKLLTDQECMSGTGWIPEGIEVECPECGADINALNYRKTCPECKIKLTYEYGKQYLIRVSRKEE